MNTKINCLFVLFFLAAISAKVVQASINAYIDNINPNFNATTVDKSSNVNIKFTQDMMYWFDGKWNFRYLI